MRHVERKISSKALECSQYYQVLVITCPHQTGKTALSAIELYHPEDLAILPRPFLGKECPCPLVGEMQPKGNEKQYRPNQSQHAKHEDEVNHPLEKTRIHD